MAVEKSRRGQSIGRTLVNEVLNLAGGERIDLLSEDSAFDFRGAFPHFAKPSFRPHPFHETAPWFIAANGDVDRPGESGDF